MLTTLFLLGAAASTAVEPVWSVTEGDTIAFDATYGQSAYGLAPDGRAFLIAGEQSRLGLAATLSLDASGQVRTGQFGHRSSVSDQLRPERILALQADRVLVAMTDSGLERAFVVLLDGDGAVQWTRAGRARDARFFGNGDVLVQMGNQLLRLAAADGSLRWANNLLDLEAHADEVAYALPSAVATSIQLAAIHREQDGQGGERIRDPLLIAIDPDSGQVQWRRSRAAAGTAAVFQSCAQIALDSDTLYAWHEQSGDQTDVVVERRAAADGALLWSTRVGAVSYSDGPCGFTATGSQIVLSTRDALSATTLVALSHAGHVLWRQQLAVTGPSRLLPLEGGDVLISSLISAIDVGDGTRLQRLDHKGVALWSADLEADGVEPRVIGNDVRLVWSPAGANGALKLQWHALDSGALLGTQNASASSRAVSAADIQHFDFDPFGVTAGRGADQRGIRLRRLDRDSGAVVWSRELMLDETVRQVDRVELVAKSVDRLILALSYVRADGRERVAVLAASALDGAQSWQSALERSPTGYRTPVVSGDGSTYVAHGRCVDAGCSKREEVLSRLAGLSGVPLWTQSIHVQLLAWYGLDLVARRLDIFGNPVVRIDGNSGQTLWSQLLDPTPLNVSVLPNVPDQLLVVAERTAASARQLQLQSLSAQAGAPGWSTPIGAPGEDLRAGTLTQFFAGQFLFSARWRPAEPAAAGMARPHLSRVDPDTGALLWTSRPALTGDRWRTIRFLRGGTIDSAWARSLRFVLDNQLGAERQALTLVQLSNGDTGPEYQYASDYDGPLGSFPLGQQGQISGLLFDHTPQVENYALDGSGLSFPRLQKWPVLFGPHSGDIRLGRLGEAGVLTALGPDTLVELEVSSQSLADLSGLKLGFESTDDALVARFVDCQPISGMGSCTALAGSRVLALTLGPAAALRVRFELHDPRFRPAAPAAEPARGLFYVEAPHTFGDQDLGNNIHEIALATGGFSNSFE